MPCLEYRTLQSMEKDAQKEIPEEQLEHTNNRAFLPITVQYFMWPKDFPQGPSRRETWILHEMFKSWKRRWRRTGPFRRLRKLIEATPFPENTRKVVAFGGGAVPCRMREGADEVASRANQVQVALVQMVSERLSRQQGPDFQGFAQDRGWQYIGKSDYQIPKVTMLPDPFGILEVDETTVVIAINPDIPVRQIIADIARPAVLLWRKLANSTMRTKQYVSRSRTAIVNANINGVPGSTPAPRAWRGCSRRSTRKSRFPKTTPLAGLRCTSGRR